ncbi:MAG TPA: hypothetical protein VG819_08535 [Rhizomicrobium sp.]|nr:hypothetical protein [Rhizomicrobium sp.]
MASGRLHFGLVPLALAAAVQFASAAPLHYPLPEDSLARNGEPQVKSSHVLFKSQPDIAPLPRVGNHPHADKGLKRHYSGTPIDVLRYHYDNYPTGWNQNETDLTPATVASASFGKLTTLNVDGNVMAQPLLVSNFRMPDDSIRNVLIVATGHNTVYAYDAQDYSLLWQVNLGKSQTSGDVGCFDIKPEYGISSTPVIVRTADNAATIYLVAATEPAQFSFHTKLYALDLGTGHNVLKAREIKPAANLATGGKIHFDPQNQWSRAALAYNNGSIYVGIGSHCDNNAGQISGWMLRYDASNLKLTAKFNTIDAVASYELSSIWMSGYSPAIDPDGNVYAVTGNGYFNNQKGKKGYGESVLRLSPNLKKPKTFTPQEWQNLNNGDSDFGSGGAMLIPTVEGQQAPPMVVAEGKAGKIYLLDATNPGGLQGGASQPLQVISEGACWCGPAYYEGPSGGIVFYQGGDVLRAYSVNTGATPSLTLTASGTSGAGGGGSFPIVSTNGSMAGTGIVWLIRRGNPTEQLEAYDAASLGAPIFAQNAGDWSNGSRSYLSPLVANGRVYVGSKNAVTVFGLTD